MWNPWRSKWCQANLILQNKHQMSRCGLCPLKWGRPGNLVLAKNTPPPRLQWQSITLEKFVNSWCSKNHLRQRNCSTCQSMFEISHGFYPGWPFFSQKNKDSRNVPVASTKQLCCESWLHLFNCRIFALFKLAHELCDNEEAAYVVRKQVLLFHWARDFIDHALGVVLYGFVQVLLLVWGLGSTNKILECLKVRVIPGHFLTFGGLSQGYVDRQSGWTSKQLSDIISID